MNDYFKPCYESWARPRTFCGNIRQTFRWLRWYHQRATRGWADCDWWGMDGYLCEIIVPMLYELRYRRSGHPANLTSEQWDAKLDEMIQAWEAAGMVIDDDYFKTISPQFPEVAASHEEITAWGKASEDDQVIFRQKGRTFLRYFFGLWD